ncbi:MAG: 7-cyano-7-deazaguanine synthase QueC [Methanobacterium sp. BRmetb2]|nr:MAG: 7-cyano-7-deazaguanine synthase QueC [Methanobacterium sp. BRmetb2]
MGKSKEKAISVLSGGLDSAVATSFYKDRYDIHALTFNYGQKSAEMEISSAKAICDELGIDHTVIDLPWMGKISGSALTSSKEIPELEMSQLDDEELCNETAGLVWVPGRNIVFTAIATAYAEAENAKKIIVGWDYEEAITFPDNSKEFLEAFNHLLLIGSPEEIEIKAPLIKSNKKEIVEIGKDIGAPLHLSYSCYLGDELHCGVCESCMRRRRAFEQAEIQDETKYSN